MNHLIFWPVGGGEIRFQTSCPIIVKNLSRRVGIRLVGYNVEGGYLRLFQAKMSLTKAKKLTDRLANRFEPKHFKSQPFREVFIEDRHKDIPSFVLGGAERE
jgi:hypothetical protein